MRSLLTLTGERLHFQLNRNTWATSDGPTRRLLPQCLVHRTEEPCKGAGPKLWEPLKEKKMEPSSGVLAGLGGQTLFGVAVVLRALLKWRHDHKIMRRVSPSQMSVRRRSRWRADKAKRGAGRNANSRPGTLTAVEHRGAGINQTIRSIWFRILQLKKGGQRVH
jgi:hypothetical protein